MASFRSSAPIDDLRVMRGVDSGVPSDGSFCTSSSIAISAVDDAIAPAVAKSRAVLARFEELSESFATLEGDALDAGMEELGKIQDQIDAGDLWDLDRKVDIACAALRCPPRDAKTDVLSLSLIHI